MNGGAALIFDEQTEAALRMVWQSVADFSGSPFMLGLDYPPHLTLFSCETIDVAGLRAAWGALAAVTEPVPVHFAALGVFPGELGVIFLSPIHSPALLNLHAALWDVSGPYTTGRAGYYAPGEWVPHATIGFNLSPEQQGKIIQGLATYPLPRKGHVAGIKFGTFIVEGGSVLEHVYFDKSS